jgi:hypothetical protein
VAQAEGRKHDFTLFKETHGGRIHQRVHLIGDSGYEGLGKWHENSTTPYKAQKDKPLTRFETKANKNISKKRICIENMNAVIKVFKIMSYPYRNHLKRHNLRLSLICGIINFELKNRG